MALIGEISAGDHVRLGRDYGENAQGACGLVERTCSGGCCVHVYFEGNNYTDNINIEVLDKLIACMFEGER